MNVFVDGSNSILRFVPAVGRARLYRTINSSDPFFDVEDYQLDPVVRAMQMPRVSLLIGDDVGLAKTIEAGRPEDTAS